MEYGLFLSRVYAQRGVDVQYLNHADHVIHLSILQFIDQKSIDKDNHLAPNGAIHNCSCHSKKEKMISGIEIYLLFFSGHTSCAMQKYKKFKEINSKNLFLCVHKK